MCKEEARGLELHLLWKYNKPCISFSIHFHVVYSIRLSQYKPNPAQMKKGEEELNLKLAEAGRALVASQEETAKEKARADAIEQDLNRQIQVRGRERIQSCIMRAFSRLCHSFTNPSALSLLYPHSILTLPRLSIPNPSLLYLYFTLLLSPLYLSSPPHPPPPQKVTDLMNQRYTEALKKLKTDNQILKTALHREERKWRQKMESLGMGGEVRSIIDGEWRRKGRIRERKNIWVVLFW